ncbi:hypothetical protein FJ970_18000 [Mesorhizobium sp. B2-1-8]|uniref:hypothetical protein n=1 Tax=Mesorhizobium sp. B2-1-8 TaxID=2589967 RepID=UPI00112D96CD|nr:hypothetical protein [Mesorhizobium sp. B2-1-8]UCI17026.1 hypothetical protein FJ970_18000 [Mesorhizobium sp. B2-1-8]
MKVQDWHSQVSYRENERCRYAGQIWEAKFDLTRGLKPVGHLSEKFWRRVSTVPPVKASRDGRKTTNGYLTRSMSHN